MIESQKRESDGLVSIVEESPNRFRISKKESFRELEGSREVKLSKVKDEFDDFIDMLFRRYGIEKRCKWEDVDNVGTNISEIIDNADCWGNNLDPDKNIWVEVYVAGRRKKTILEVTIRDEGNGFNYKHVLRCHRKAKGRKNYNDFRDNQDELSWGFGLFMVLNTAASVKWNKTGNEIKMKYVMRNSDIFNKSSVLGTYKQSRKSAA